MDDLDIQVRVKTRHLPEHLPSDSKQFAFADARLIKQTLNTFFTFALRLQKRTANVNTL